ncbi:MAG: hypothetical protein ACXVCR_19990, partial [Bdellovibrio sp.]
SGVYKPIERKINPSFSLGDPQVFLNVFFPAYERSLTKSVKQYELNGSTFQMKVPELGISRLGDYARFIFSKSQSIYKDNQPLMDESFKKFKKAAINNSLELLSRINNVSNEEINSKDLQDALDKLDWSSIKGVTRSDFDFELDELKKWENNP